MVKKSLTIDDLARMVQKGFEHTASKDEIGDMRHETKAEFSDIRKRLDRIENILIRGHENRIERLEDKVRVMEVAFSRMPTKNK